MTAQGTVFIYPGDDRIQIGTSLPTGIPVSEIQLIQYTGPRLIEAVSVADLKKWFEDRIEEGFAFEAPDSNDGQ